MAKTAERDVVDVDAKEDGRIPYRREFLAVTPAMAKDFLSQLHPDQRAQRDARIEQYAEDMKRGHWRSDTEDTILIDWNGYLIDGQNRLRAVVQSGKTIEFSVVWGKDPAVMGVKDTGAARTVADSLRISGRGEGLSQADLLIVGAVARRQLHWESGRYSQGSMKFASQATHSDIRALLDRQPDIYNAAKIGMDAARSTRPPLISAAAYGFFWLNANRIDSDAAYRWQTFWLTPDDLPGGSPIAVVRERFFRHKMAQKGSGYGENRAMVLKPDEQLALVIRAWNLFLADRRTNLTRLQISRGKLGNDNFPQFLTREQAIREADKYDRDITSRARTAPEKAARKAAKAG